MTAEGASPTRPILLLLAYLPLLCLIPLALVKRDAEVRWHALNGSLLCAAMAAVALLATLFGIVVPASTCVYAAAMAAVVLLYLGIALLAAVMALRGQRLMIPGISRRATKIAASR